MVSTKQRLDPVLANDQVRQLIRENEHERSRERRSIDRQPFVRPVQILVGRNREFIFDGFSRDISSLGMGVISQQEFPIGQVATLSVHPLGEDTEAAIRARLRWSREFGEGWYWSGWMFLE